jgi:hypothetical protein
MTRILEDECASWHPWSREVVMTMLDAQDLVPEAYPTVAAALWQPERRLMLAVLEDAIEAYLGNAGALRGIRRARFREAASWFRSEDTEWPFSFVNICDACGLAADVIRRQLGRRIRSQVLGVSGNPAGWGGSSWAGTLELGGRTYTRPSGSTWSWNSGLPSFDQRASSRGGNLTA